MVIKLVLKKKFHKLLTCWFFCYSTPNILNIVINSFKMQIEDACEQVMCQKDYLSIICSFLTLKEVVWAIPSISSFHYKFINDPAQKKLIESFFYLNYIDQKISIDYNCDPKDTNSNKLSVCEQISQFCKQINAHFRTTVSNGQLMLQYSGKRGQKPNNIKVEVIFRQGNTNRNPIKISWGCRYCQSICWNDIHYIAYGLWTPRFRGPVTCTKDQLSSKSINKLNFDESKCFSVVGKQEIILDVEAPNKDTARLWVDALRHLKQQTKQESDKLAKLRFGSGNLPEPRDSNIQNVVSHIHCFYMTHSKVIDDLEREKIWVIDDPMTCIFQVQQLYHNARIIDVPPAKHEDWIKEQVTDHLALSNRWVRSGLGAFEVFQYVVNC